MKRTANTKARLELSREKVKDLSDRDLTSVAGGRDIRVTPSGVCPTHV
jgi:hypothetical protein